MNSSGAFGHSQRHVPICAGLGADPLRPKVPQGGGAGNRIVPRKRLTLSLSRVLSAPGSLVKGCPLVCVPIAPRPSHPLCKQSWQIRSMTACQLRGLPAGDVRVHRGRRTPRGVHGRRALSPHPRGPVSPVAFPFRALGRQVGSRPRHP